MSGAIVDAKKFPFYLPLSFILSLAVPHVRIQGAPDIHVNQGSAINLTCIISYSPEPPAFVFWYRGNKESMKQGSSLPTFIDVYPSSMTVETDRQHSS